MISEPTNRKHNLEELSQSKQENMDFSWPTEGATHSPSSRKRINTNNNNHDRRFGGLQYSAAAASDNNNNNNNNDSENLDITKIENTRISNPLSFKLNQLSIEERSNGLYDLHGVAEKIVDENPEMLQSKTYEMTVALNSIASWGEPESLAFRKAVEKSSKYVDSLKIRFLRTDLYDAHTAAERMVRFFDEKMKYFGEEKLVDDIKFEDLCEEEVEALESGWLQLLPLRDRANRAIIFIRGDISVKYPNNETVMRVFFYLIMATHSDEEIQKNGTVAIVVSIGQKYLIPGRLALYWKLWSSLPVRQSGVHYCGESKGLHDMSLKVIAKYAEKRQVGRFRVHSGSYLECIYELMTFGIPREAIPIQDDGTCDLTHHHQMLETLKNREMHNCQRPNLEQGTPSQPDDYSPSLEEYSLSGLEQIQEENDDSGTTTTTTTSVTDITPGNIILVPGQMDILLGRGRQQEKRPGMIRLNSLLDEYWDTYEAGSKFDKTVITEIILTKLKESNCRFLGVMPGGFLECDDLSARKKIAHSFRSLRRKKKNVHGGSGVDKGC